MEEELCPEFGRDEYIERLIALRQVDPVGYCILSEALREVVEEYELEKDVFTPIAIRSTLMNSGVRSFTSRALKPLSEEGV
jgi:hypothetical protein